MFRKRLNPDADANNTLVLQAENSGCCGGDYATCKYSVIVDPFVNFASITFLDKGVEKTVSFGETITDYTLLPAAIRTALKSAGFLLDNTPGSAPKDVTVSLDGTELTVEIWGEAEVTSLNLANATEEAAVKHCNPYADCLYTVEVPVGAIAVAVDGGAEEDLGSPTTYTTGQAATVKTDIEGSTALAAATLVTVTEDTVADTFLISFRFEKAEVAFNGELAARTGCRQNFKP